MLEKVLSKSQIGRKVIELHPSANNVFEEDGTIEQIAFIPYSLLNDSLDQDKTSSKVASVATLALTTTLYASLEIASRGSESLVRLTGKGLKKGLDHAINLVNNFTDKNLKEKYEGIKNWLSKADERIDGMISPYFSRGSYARNLAVTGTCLLIGAAALPDCKDGIETAVASQGPRVVGSSTRTVQAIEYTVQSGDSVGLIPKNEIATWRGDGFNYNYPWTGGFSMTGTYTSGENSTVHYYFSMQDVLEEANPGVDFSNGLKIGQKLIVPDFHRDGCVRDQCSEQVGTFTFTGTRLREYVENSQGIMERKNTVEKSVTYRR